MKRYAAIVASVVIPIVLVPACKSDPPAQNPQPFAGPTGTYPTATTAATAAPPVTATPISVQPSPLSPPCSQPEGTCVYAKCNMQVGRCSWPCGSDADCITGATCIGAGTPLALCTGQLVH